MKKILFCLFLIILFGSQFSNARAETPTENDDVMDFHEFDAEILQDGVRYLGVLISTKEFDRITRLENEYNLNLIELESYRKTDKKYQEIIDSNDKWQKDIVLRIDDIKKTVVHQSFFEKYKGELMFISGFAAATLISVGVYELLK